MIVTTIDRKEHAVKRRLLSQALTVAAIDAMGETILSNARKFTQYLLDKSPSSDWNSVRNMTEWSAFVTSDIMGNIAFSRNWNMMESVKNRYILPVISQGVAGLNLASEILRVFINDGLT